MDNRAIGIFDSGVGGLTVVKEVIKAMPHEPIVYFGDTARVPYGSKSKETVTKFSAQIVSFLLKENVKAIIIACNTVSSNSFGALSEQFDIPFIEVITPGVEAALQATKNGRIGVIGTEATIRSNAYANKILERNPRARVFQKACPLFVPLAEEGFVTKDDPIAVLAAKKYLQELADKEIDTLLLGCTHYPLLNSCIKKAIGDKIEIVNPATETAAKMKKFLGDFAMLTAVMDETGANGHKFYVSDHSSKFAAISSVLLKKNLSPLLVDLEQYQGGITNEPDCKRK